MTAALVNVVDGTPELTADGLLAASTLGVEDATDLLCVFGAAQEIADVSGQEIQDAVEGLLGLARHGYLRFDAEQHALAITMLDTGETAGWMPVPARSVIEKVLVEAVA